MLCNLIRIASGDSNEHTQYTIFNIEKKITLNNSTFAPMVSPQRLKNKFETAVVNEPSEFEPLKVYCMYVCMYPGMHMRNRLNK